MTRKAKNQSESSAQSIRWQLLVRHPLLLKVATWLSSLSVMASASVSWAEIKPVEITAQSAVPSLFQGSPIAVEGFRNGIPAAFFGADTATTQANKELHTDLLSSDNFTVGLTAPGSKPKRSYQSKAGVPLSMQVPTDGNCNSMTSKLVSSLCTKVSSKGQTTTAQSFQSQATPGVQPLPVVNRKSTRRVSPLVSNTRPVAQAKLRLERPQALGPLATLPNALPIYVAPPQTNVIPNVSQIPTVSRTRVPSVSPLPTVQTARVGSAMPTSVAAANYQINADFIYPLTTPTPVTSPFGWRTHPITGNRRFHAGMDFGAPSGAPVVAVAAGRVVLAKWHGGYGKAVVIEHNNGQLQTLYGHMSEISVQEGQVIQQGTIIGAVGSTGNSTGAHLHFETKVPTADGWVVVDPEQEVKYALNNLRQANQYSRRYGN
jgi:murein DD-endopeptidase MepM/ murein hydrolase activator NlpD